MPQLSRLKMRGFSLIELLVVISIVTLLLAVLLPALGRAREQARRSLCLANQRQYGISVNVYANDAKGYYPGIVALGQSIYQDTAITGAYMQTNNIGEWARDSNKAAAEYIPKSITACPSADPRYATSKNAWDFSSHPNYGPNGLWSGTTDYSLKVGAGSNHAGLTYDGYDPYPAPGAGPTGNYMSFRGFYDWRFERKYSGFYFNFRQEQKNYYAPGLQSNKAIMIMDRQRSPYVSASDINNLGTYAMYKSNHEMVNDPRGAAEGANALFKDGSARWMHLAPIWGSANLDTKYKYDIAGYAEGSYSQYVDEEMASNW